VALRNEIGLTKTAFVFAGGGSFGAIQVGMLQSLAAHGITADMVVGSSVGALNGAFYAGDPTLKGAERLGTIWRGLMRQDVFLLSWRTVLSFLWRRDFLIPHDGIRKLIEDHIPYRNLQDARLPLHFVTTDIEFGDSVVLSEGSIAEAIVASTAIPGAFAQVHYRNYYPTDGAISSNTPIQVAVKKGARRLDHPADRARLCDADPAGRRGCECTACVDCRLRVNWSANWKASGPRSNISWCRLYARWSDRRTISRVHPITSSAPSRAPMPGWPSMTCSRAEFPTRCGRTATERAPLRCTAIARRSMAGGPVNFYGSLSHPRWPGRISYGAYSADWTKLPLDEQSSG
jgi:NTE family protein